MPTRGASVAGCSADLPDPRADRTGKHALGGILVTALGPALAGADAREDGEAFGEATHDWLRRFLALPSGTPSRDTFDRVSSRLGPESFRRCVGERTAGACEAAGLRHTGVGGRAARSAPGARPAGAPTRYRVGGRGPAGPGPGGRRRRGARARRHPGAAPGAGAGGGGGDARRGRVAGGDRRGGDHLPAVTGSRPGVRDAGRAAFGRACAADSAGVERDGHEGVGGGRGGHAERCATAAHDPEGAPPGRPGAAAVVLVGRAGAAEGAGAGTARYGATGRRGAAAGLGRVIRRHRAGGGGLRRRLGVAFREGGRGAAAGPAGASRGLVRRVAAPPPKRDPARGSAKAERVRAGWDDDLKLQVRQGCAED